MWPPRSVALALALIACGPSPAPRDEVTQGGEAPLPRLELGPRPSEPALAIELDEARDLDGVGQYMHGLRGSSLPEALEAYAGERWIEAAEGFERVLADPDAENGERQIARFFLGKALAHAGFPDVARSLFDEELESGGWRARFARACVAWLLSIDRERPGVLYRGMPELAALASEGSPDWMLLAFARLLRELEENERADQLAAWIRPDSPRWAAAQWARVELALETGRPHEAARMLRAVADRPSSSDEERDLAWLSLGELYLTWASRHTADAERSARATVNGLVALDHVRAESVHRPDALLASAWAARLLGEPERAAGYLAQLSEAALAGTPEARVLRASLAFEQCRLDAIGGERRALEASRDELRAQRRSDPEAAYSLLGAIDRGEQGAHVGLAWRLWRDADLAAARSIIAAVDEQAARASELPRAVAERVRTELALRRALELDLLGSAIDARANALLAELEDAIAQVTTLEGEAPSSRERCAAQRSR